MMYSKMIKNITTKLCRFNVEVMKQNGIAITSSVTHQSL